MMWWAWDVETVIDGAVVRSERRVSCTPGGVRSPWGPGCHDTEENAFDALKLEATPRTAREYQRAILIRKSRKQISG